MRTFAELLREYVDRAGISDAELARSLGVRRQTIFRWKEGLSERPRHREDVTGLGARLRLSIEERDLLLLSAGFAPEVAAVPQQPAAPLPPGPAEKDAEVAEPTSHGAQVESRPLLVPPVVLAQDGAPISAAAGAELPAGQSLPGRRITRVPGWVWGSGALVLVVVLAAVRLLSGGQYPVAAQTETLILVGQFVNYSGAQQGYNVAGRLQAALEQEVRAGRLDGVRVAVWPDEITDEASARAVIGQSHAAIVIWGEYDSGRVLCHFTGLRPEVAADQFEQLIASPAGLSATINSTLPEEVRHIALVTVARLDLAWNNPERARAVLAQALARPPAATDAAAGLYFWLGYAAQKDRPPDWESASLYYTHALDLVPGITAARNNRGIVYLQRGEAGDLGRALDDLNEVLASTPDDAAAYNNRAATYLRRRAAGDQEHALADVERAVALAPEAPEGYFNRGLIYLRQGDAVRWKADFQRVLALEPRHVGALGSLCWGYALEQQPATALPYCDQAVAVDPTAASRDSRGVVYAELGRLNDAVAEFRAFVAWLDQTPGSPYAASAGTRRAWLATLEAGRNPIDAAVLQRLRQE